MTSVEEKASDMNLDRCISILKDDILEEYESHDKTSEYNYIIGDYIMDGIMKIDIIITIHKYNICADIINTNYSNGPFKQLLYMSVCIQQKGKQLTNLGKALTTILKDIYNLKNNFKYSKILDSLKIGDELKKQEDVFIAHEFITHKSGIVDCCVCNEKNTVLTHCKHSLCRGCFNQLQKLDCPLCRTSLVCCH